MRRILPSEADDGVNRKHGLIVPALVVPRSGAEGVLVPDLGPDGEQFGEAVRQPNGPARQRRGKAGPLAFDIDEEIDRPKTLGRFSCRV